MCCAWYRLMIGVSTGGGCGGLGGCSMKIMRAYKYRLYPTAEQEARLSAWVPLGPR
ncbi:MAG: hypothetical protein CMM10_06740 [Rhodospirillaceae bacterium]|nr:hypothetical protein [Rhodospirillaceae bacterium]